MAIAFRSASGVTGSASLTVTLPSGVATGDLLVVVLSKSTTGTVTPPAGWTQLRHDTDGTAYSQTVFYRIATASESASWSFSIGSGSTNGSAVCVAYSGVDTTAPFHANGAQAAGASSTSITAPSVTTTVAATILAAFGIANGNGTISTPSATTSRVSTISGSSSTPSIRLVDAPHIAAGATTSRVATSSTSARNIGTTLALLAANSAPNAPTLTAPANGATIDRTSTQRFAWTFSDPDAGDSQSAYNLRYRVVGAGSWTETGWVALPNTFHDIAAGTFADATDYEWQVATKDAQGVAGPYSGSSFFTAATAPASPTITAPINGANVSQTETVTWSTPDQDAYQLRILNGATPVYDTGTVESSTARSLTVAYPDNSTTRITQVRVRDNGLWSAYAQVTNTVSWTPPATPSFSLLPDPDSGSLLVTITNPAPSGGEPTVSYNDVYIDDGDGEELRATMLAPNSSWTYWTPRSGRDYDANVRVVAVGDNQTTASS